VPGCVEALARLSISSDASISSPGAVLEQIRDCVLRHGFALEEVLPTANPACILRLERNGRIEPGMPTCWCSGRTRWSW